MTNKRVAVVLSGCGVFDGAEIHESVLSLLALDRQGAQYQCFAPDIQQHHVIDHTSGEEMDESRSVLKESARIARGRPPCARARGTPEAGRRCRRHHRHLPSFFRGERRGRGNSRKPKRWSGAREREAGGGAGLGISEKQSAGAAALEVRDGSSLNAQGF